MPKRLTKLVITEVSAVDRGAGEGVKVMLLKRDKPVEKQLTWDVKDAHGRVISNHSRRKDAKRERNRLNEKARGDRSIAAAHREIAENKRFMEAHAHAAVQKTEEKVVETDVAKAAAAVVQKFNARCEQVAKTEGISLASATLRIASANGNAAFGRESSDFQLWQDYRKASEIVVASAPAPVAAPAPMVSDAYAKMMKKAGKVAKRENISVASAFSKVFSANPDLAQADRAWNVAKANGGGIDPDEQLVRALVASLGVSEDHARGLALEIRSKKPNLGTLARSGVAA